MLRRNMIPFPLSLGPGSAKKKSVGYTFDTTACPPPPDVQCWGATQGPSEQHERTFFSQRPEHLRGNQHCTSGGKGARILDHVFCMADFFFADPGMRLQSVLFGIVLELECLVLFCPLHV